MCGFLFQKVQPPFTETIYFFPKRWLNYIVWRVMDFFKEKLFILDVKIKGEKNEEKKSKYKMGT